MKDLIFLDLFCSFTAYLRISRITIDFSILRNVSIALQDVQRFAVHVHKNLRPLEEAGKRFIVVRSRLVRSTECTVKH